MNMNVYFHFQAHIIYLWTVEIYTRLAKSKRKSMQLEKNNE